ncbi:MAG: DUF4292 domain-containing protein [bacterium]
MVTFLAAGCATTSRVPDLSNITTQTIQSKVLRNFNKLVSFEGRARVIIELPGEGYRGSSRVYINLPDSVYVKTEAILGIDIGALFLDRSYFGAYAPRENVLYYGEAELLDLRDFLQVEIETDELVEVLTGLIRIAPEPGATPAFDDGKFLISFPLGNGTQRVWVDPKKYVVTRSQLVDTRGRVILLKEFSRFKTRKGIVLPQTIKITRPLARERLTVYYTSQKINKLIVPEKFRLKTSKNARRVYWGDLERSQLGRNRKK